MDIPEGDRPGLDFCPVSQKRGDRYRNGRPEGKINSFPGTACASVIMMEYQQAIDFITHYSITLRNYLLWIDIIHTLKNVANFRNLALAVNSMR